MNGKSGKRGKSVKSGERLGRDWEEIGKSGQRLGRDGVRVPPMFPLFPNLFTLSPLFPLSEVSAVSYPTPNPVEKGVLGAVGRTG